MLRPYPNIYIIDGDTLAKIILCSCTHRANITQILDARVFTDNAPNLKLIAQIIFSNPEKRVALENYLHPYMWSAVHLELALLPRNAIAIVESALIYEKGREAMFDGIIVVTCPIKEQVRRMHELRGMTHDDITGRMNAQLPSREKERRAQFVIRTQCTEELLAKRVRTLYKKIIAQCTL